MSAIAAARAKYAALGLWLLLALAAIAADVPYLSGRVVDNAETLSASARDALTSKLKAYEARTGHQIAVLTVPALGDDSIEEFANGTFSTWKLGRKGQDDGVLLVIAPKEHKLRIEVGYGLEGNLTDVASSRIIRNVITPAFKAGDFDRGVQDGVDAIMAAIDGQAPPAEAPATSAKQGFANFEGPDLPWPMRILLGAFIFGIIGIFTWVGIITPGVGWFLYVFLIPFWAMFPLIIIGLKGTFALFLTYVIGYPIAKMVIAHTDWHKKMTAAMGTNGAGNVGGYMFGGGGFTSSGSSGGFSSGGGGGGFSGGVGSSGGGGSSGSW